MFAWRHASAVHSTTGSTDWSSTTIDDKKCCTYHTKGLMR
jgi:hypothetical protein